MDDLKELEDALKDLDGSKEKSVQNEERPEEKKEVQLSREEEVAFHRGSLNTLVNERNELLRMLKNVEAIIQAHLKRLEELGAYEGKK